MTAISYATAVDARTLPFKDRRASLKVAGVLLVVLGALSACMGGVTPVGLFVAAKVARQQAAAVAAAAATTGPAATPPRPQPVMEADYRTMVFAGGMYVVVAATMIWIGVGTIRTRRWTRPVMQVICWTWLISGGASFAYLMVFGVNMRDLMTASRGAPQPPRVAVYAAAAITGVLMFVMMVVMPSVLLWLYSRRGTRETLDYFDPRVRWTDRCPTRVLAVAFWLVLGAFGVTLHATYRVFPVYGRLLTGAPAVASMLALAMLFLWLAWGVFRLRTWAWWGTLVACSFWAGSMVWTFTWTGYEEFYRQAGYSPAQVDMLMRSTGQFQDSTVWMIALWSVVLTVYLLYVRKHFRVVALASLSSEPVAASG